MTGKLFYWLPRVLAIVFIGFISIFALDVVGEPRWFLALMIHLIPSYVLVGATAVAWKKEQVGGLIFIAVGLASLVFTRFESLIIFIPTVVIGAIFLSGKSLTRVDSDTNTPFRKRRAGQ